MAAITKAERTRTHTFALAPKAEWKKVCLIELLDSGQNGPERGHHKVSHLEWDDHCWRQRGHAIKEEPTNRSTTRERENLASDSAPA